MFLSDLLVLATYDTWLGRYAIMAGLMVGLVALENRKVEGL
jgi:hypothetical protein